jgi:hypothetical protein
MDLAKLQRHEEKNGSRPLNEILMVFNVAKFLAHFQLRKRPFRVQAEVKNPTSSSEAGLHFIAKRQSRPANRFATYGDPEGSISYSSIIMRS